MEAADAVGGVVALEPIHERGRHGFSPRVGLPAAGRVLALVGPDHDDRGLLTLEERGKHRIDDFRERVEVHVGQLLERRGNWRRGGVHDQSQIGRFFRGRCEDRPAGGIGQVSRDEGGLRRCARAPR